MRSLAASVVTVGRTRVIRRLSTRLCTRRLTLACVGRPERIIIILLLHIEYVLGSRPIAPMLPSVFMLLLVN